MTDSRITNMYLTVLCTCPNNKMAKELANKLIEAKLAACVSIIPGIESIYMWQEKLANTREYLLLIKTSKARYAAVELLIKQNHTYACPEIIAIPIEQGSKEYLTWLSEELKHEN